MIDNEANAMSSCTEISFAGYRSFREVGMIRAANKMEWHDTRRTEEDSAAEKPFSDVFSHWKQIA